MISVLIQANYFSLAIDESTDNTDVALMCVYVRYFDVGVQGRAAFSYSIRRAHN